MKQNVIIADIKSVNLDGNSPGHYFAVAENYWNLFHDSLDIKIAGGPIYKKKFSEEQLYLLPYDNRRKSKIGRMLNSLKNGRYLLKNCGSDTTILFQYTATNALLLLLSLYRPKSRVYLILYEKSIQSSGIKTLLYRFAKGKIHGIICSGKEIGEALGKEYCVVPDYIYVQKKTGRYSTYDEREHDFGLYGIINRNKGIFEAAEYLSNTPYSVKVSGMISEASEDAEMYEALKKLQSGHANLSLENGYLSDDKYDEYLRNTKYVVLNYSDAYAFRSSGVIFDAIFRRTPVVVRDRAYVQFVRKYGIGFVYSDLNEIDFNALMNEENYKRYQEAIDSYLNLQMAEAEKVVQFIRG